MTLTNEEKELLSKMEQGKLDGCVGDDLMTSGGSIIWQVVRNGVPTKFKQGPSRRFFNGEENERIEGVLHIEQEWVTDEEKVEFLRRYGWLMKDEAVKAYSAKYKKYAY